MVHGRSIRQVKRLFHRLYNPDDFIYIHVDSRSQYMYDHLKPLENGRFNVIVTETRFATIWGGVSLLTMMISSMREMLESQWDMDFIINVSGSDYLIKTPEELKTYLSGHVGMNFVFHNPHEDLAKNKMSYHNHTFVECDDYMYRIGPRILPTGIRYLAGSDFFCLSRNFVEYITNTSGNDTLLEGLYSVYNYSIAAPEKFFLAALQNSQFCTTHYSSNIRMVNWDDKKGCHCHRPTADWCGCSPLTLTQKRLDFIDYARNYDEFFGRKFDSTVDMSVLNTLDKYLCGVDNVPSKYWMNVWHQNYDDENALSTFAYSLIGHQSSIMVQELTIYYENDEQNSLLVLFTDEFGIQSEHKYLSKPSSKSTDTDDIISVGNQYDYTDKIFKQTLPIFDTKPSLLISAKSEKSYDDEKVQKASVFWISPQNTAKFVQRNVAFNLTKGPQLLTYPYESLSQGLWTVVYMDFKQKFYSLEFLVFNAKDVQQEENKSVALFQHEFEDIQTILMKKSSIQTWIESNFIFDESCVSESCETIGWSSKSHDFSIDLKLSK